MSRMSKFSNEHGCGSVLETQTETDDGTGNSEHDKPVGERLKEHSDNDDHRADDDGVLSPNPLNKPPEKELRSNAAEALCAVEYTELGAGGIVKVPDFVSLSAVREESWC
jgi:hypothetical protein